MTTTAAPATPAAMIEINTTDLIGPALDWAVAKTEGAAVVTDPNSPSSRQMRVDADSINGWYCYSPSTDWSQGGPLFAKYAIGFVGHDADNWLAFSSPMDETHQDIGPTHLIAACRMIVSAIIGDTVSVPVELVEVVQP